MVIAGYGVLELVRVGARRLLNRQGRPKTSLCVRMKGDGGGCEERDFLFLGRSGSSEVVGPDDSSFPGMLSSLSRNGLSMLAGGAKSLTSLRNLPQPSGKVCGGAFTGFYRRGVENPHNKSSATRGISTTAAANAPASVKPDVENLSPDECWRLILKLGRFLLFNCCWI